VAGTGRHFVTAIDWQLEEHPWGMYEWMITPRLVDSELLLLARCHVLPGQGQVFHSHPEHEEALYVLEGFAEQWVDRDRRVIGPGEVVHVPKGVVHATYNVGHEMLRLLAVWCPALGERPAWVDCSTHEPWISLRRRAPS
jgi:quercetin dioxygenase-like cupin family protein